MGKPVTEANEGARVSASPIEHDLAALPAAHDLETFEEFRRRQAVGDDLAHVEPAFQHGDHLVPGLEHFAPIDSLDGELLEDDLVPVDERRLRRQAEQRDPAADSSLVKERGSDNQIRFGLSATYRFDFGL